MRALPVPVVLTSMVLTGWAGGASGQQVPIQPQASQMSATAEQAACLQNQDQQPGVISQPTPDCPGLVAGVTAGELYTDNLKLAGTGQPKETSWITMARPFIKAAADSPRFSGLVDYSLTGYLYAGQSQHDQIAQDLDAMGTVTLVPQHFFLDGTARYSRAIINNQLAAGSGTFFLNNNLANIAVGTLSPWWTQQIGTLGTATLRYTQGRVVYNRRGISGDNRDVLSGIPDVTSNAVQFSFASPQYERWAWNFGYSQQRLEPDFGRSVQFAIVKAGASLQFNPNTQLLADAGAENRYRPDGTVGHLDAGFWDAGVNWAGVRDNFKVLVGHRFFGRTGELLWTHTAALLTTTLSYVEQPTDLNQQLLGENPGEIVLQPLNPNRLPSLTERQVYLMKRAMATATYQMPRGHLTLALYDESRHYFLANVGQEKVANASLSWLFDLGPFTSLTPMLGWQRYRFQTGEVSYSRFGQVALKHQVDPGNFWTVEMRNDSRDVYEPIPGARDYRVNVIYFSWTHLF